MGAKRSAVQSGYEPDEEPVYSSRRAAPNNVVQMPPRAESETRKHSEMIVCVRRIEDSQNIINSLIEGKSLMLNLEEIDDTQRQRVIDMLGGGSICPAWQDAARLTPHVSAGALDGGCGQQHRNAPECSAHRRVQSGISNVRMGRMILYHLLGGVNLLIRLLICLVILSCVLPWFLPAHHRVLRLVDRIVEPVVSPVRGWTYRLWRGPFDISPWLVLLLLSLLQGFVQRWRYAALRLL